MDGLTDGQRPNYIPLPIPSAGDNKVIASYREKSKKISLILPSKKKNYKNHTGFI
jgi:hypothetical protein